MFDDYKTLVLQDYQEKRSAATLSLNLVNPTSAKVKADCIQVCEERFLKSDEGVLRVFFNQQDGESAYRRAISQCDTDIFKPLCNFIRGKTSNTDDRNIELLAWLIDFDKRPYSIWRNADKSGTVYGMLTSAHESIEIGQETFEEVGETKEDAEIGNSDIREKEEKTEMLPESKSPVERKVQKANGSLADVKRSKVYGMGLIFLIICVVVYLIDSRVSGDMALREREECMYWDKDHYQPVACSEKIDDTPIYALDREKMTRLKKINRPDTLTRMSIGRVWYSKISNHVEFYTSDGYHPIHMDKRLKPVTELILEKYARRSLNAIR